MHSEWKALNKWNRDYLVKKLGTLRAFLGFKEFYIKFKDKYNLIDLPCTSGQTSAVAKLMKLFL